MDQSDSDHYNPNPKETKVGPERRRLGRVGAVDVSARQTHQASALIIESAASSDTVVNECLAALFGLRSTPSGRGVGNGDREPRQRERDHDDSCERSETGQSPTTKPEHLRRPKWLPARSRSAAATTPTSTVSPATTCARACRRSKKKRRVARGQRQALADQRDPLEALEHHEEGAQQHRREQRPARAAGSA
jgi:hypothetical protein